MSPHSHPAHRKRGTLSQAEYEALERQQPKGDPAKEREARERSDRWMRELDGADDMAAKQSFIGRIFVGTD